METYSVDLHDQLFVFSFLHDSPKSMRMIDEKQRKKNDMALFKVGISTDKTVY